MKETPRIRVLVVGKTSGVLPEVTRMLQGATATPFEILWEREVSSAPMILTQETVDIVLLELGTTEDPPETIVRRFSRKTPGSPLIAVVETAPPGLEVALLEAGADAYIEASTADGATIATILRQAYERALARRKRDKDSTFFQLLVENGLDGLSVLKSDGSVRYTSPALKRMAGYEDSDNIENNFTKLLHPDDLEKAMKMIELVFQNPHEPVVGEVRCRHKTGSWLWLEARAMNYVRDPSINGIIINLRDVTQRRQAEEELKESEQRFKEIFHGVHDEILLLDVSGRIIRVNNRVYDILGYQAEDILGQTIAELDLFGEEDLLIISELIVTSLAMGEVAQSLLEVNIKHKEGHFLPIELSASPVWGQEGELEGLLCIIRDITERKRVEAELQAYQQRLQEALAKIRLSMDELSTPVMQIWNRVLALPLIGIIDDRRAERIMEVVLQRIVATQSEVIIIDVTGVPTMDLQVSNLLIRTIRSVSLLGAQCVLTGITPEIAQAMIQQGLELHKVVTKRDLEEGLKWAFHYKGLQLGRRPTRSTQKKELTPALRATPLS